MKMKKLKQLQDRYRDEILTEFIKKKGRFPTSLELLDIEQTAKEKVNESIH